MAGRDKRKKWGIGAGGVVGEIRWTVKGGDKRKGGGGGVNGGKWEGGKKHEKE